MPRFVRGYALWANAWLPLFRIGGRFCLLEVIASIDLDYIGLYIYIFFYGVLGIEINTPTSLSSFMVWVNVEYGFVIGRKSSMSRIRKTNKNAYIPDAPVSV